ncbi:hypothetical protein SEA_HORTUS1_59 [Microbacterium phage Hortus1]|nr:hypothetical protein SEA_HORTUS1_59 [Microbacterium phage Hortus1]AWY05630.1 hypothetical protein SEA_OLINDD_59 [Microbacterium phage OlinDD]
MPDGRLFIWPKGSKKVEAVKEVVMALDLGYSVKPFWYNVESSADVSRVLVLEAGFENGPVIDYIRPMKKAQLEEAVRWALGANEESRGARLALDTMKRIFGEGLTMRIEKDEEEEDPNDWLD